MQIKFYIADDKIEELLKDEGYQSSTILMLSKVDLKLGINPCYLPEFSHVACLRGFMKRRVYWKTPYEKKKILRILSDILYYLKTETKKSSYRFYYSSNLMNVRLGEDGFELEYHYSWRPEDKQETLICFTPEKIMTRKIKKLIGC